MFFTNEEKRLKSVDTDYHHCVSMKKSRVLAKKKTRSSHLVFFGFYTNEKTSQKIFALKLYLV